MLFGGSWILVSVERYVRLLSLVLHAFFQKSLLCFCVWMLWIKSCISTLLRWHFPGSKGSWAGVCMVRMCIVCSKNCSDALEVKWRTIPRCLTLLEQHWFAGFSSSVTVADLMVLTCSFSISLLDSCSMNLLSFKAHLENLVDDEVSYSHFVHFVQTGINM